jgi:hypothetical protein
MNALNTHCGFPSSGCFVSDDDSKMGYVLGDCGEMFTADF